MRRIFPLLPVLLILIPGLGKAQSKSTNGKWTATFTPALIPLPSGGQFGIQPGVEYNFKPRLSLLVEVTFQTGKNQHSDSAALNKKYFRIKPELRYHFPGKNHRLSKYIGFQASYAFRSFKNEKEGFYYDDLPYNYVYAFDEAKISSPITTTSIQFGLILTDGKRFAADVFAGTGLRFVNTSFSDVENLRQEMRSRPPDWFTATASYQKIGWLSELHLNAGVRFMYRFGSMR
jgi:hypothetical protein